MGSHTTTEWHKPKKIPILKQYSLSLDPSHFHMLVLCRGLVQYHLTADQRLQITFDWGHWQRLPLLPLLTNQTFALLLLTWFEKIHGTVCVICWSQRPVCYYDCSILVSDWSEGVEWHFIGWRFKSQVKISLTHDVCVSTVTANPID